MNLCCEPSLEAMRWRKIQLGVSETQYLYGGGIDRQAEQGLRSFPIRVDKSIFVELNG